MSAPTRGNIHVYYSDIQFERSSSLKLLGQSKPNFMGMKVYINGHGYMTKMAVMAINSKNL